MGLPFIAVNLVSTFMFKDLGISDTQIAFWTSVIMMPWTLKFLWSPFLEMYRTKKFFVIITQLLSGLLFGLVAFSLKFDYFFAISISTMAVIAFSGATHDIACDGVYMAELSPADQAKYIGVQGAFYNIAKLVANGGLVALAGMLAESFGAVEGRSVQDNMPAYKEAWMVIFIVIAVLLVVLGLYHSKMLPCTQVPEHARRWQGSDARIVGGDKELLHQAPHHLLHLFHHPLSFCRGLCDEDSSAVSACLSRSRGAGSLTDRNRYTQRCDGVGSLCLGVFAGRHLRVEAWTEEDTVFALRRVQLPLYGLYVVGRLPAGKPLSDRGGHCGGILRIRLRLCRADLVHDAADSSGKASDVPLRLCVGHHESGCHASGHDERFLQ